MCVTSGPAIITNTKTFVHATRSPDGRSVHVSGYQNESRSSGVNCMFLNFAGTSLQLVRGPERTRTFMEDLTADLLELAPVMRSRNIAYGGDFPTRGAVVVEDYGDYTTVRSEGPADILGALATVREDRRPNVTQRFREFVDFYMMWSPVDSFVLACSSGLARPIHPIVVSYTPHDPNVLTIPGLDGHDGNLPTPGAPVRRDFAVAFGLSGVELPHRVYYNDATVGSAFWAPPSVAGFVDNRPEGPNGDYVVSIDDVRRGLTGRELAAQLIAA